jgi:kanamycin nucleotidyltransferase
MALAKEVAGRAKQQFQAVAVAAYGSLARGDDRWYSDIEMLCIVDRDLDETVEWIHDGWQVEVDVRSREALLGAAGRVSADWAITHANYVYTLPLDDPTGLFPVLAQAVRTAPKASFDRAIADLCVGPLYGATAKLRNARAQGDPPPPGFVFYIAKLGYWMLGLINRHPYSTAARALAESLTLPNRIPGYDELCRMTLTGDIVDGEKVFDACENFWQGAATWVAERQLVDDTPTHVV